jgi:hypothetical protein
VDVAHGTAHAARVYRPPGVQIPEPPLLSSGFSRWVSTGEPLLCQLRPDVRTDCARSRAASGLTCGRPRDPRSDLHYCRWLALAVMGEIRPCDGPQTAPARPAPPATAPGSGSKTAGRRLGRRGAQPSSARPCFRADASMSAVRHTLPAVRTSWGEGIPVSPGYDKSARWVAPGQTRGAYSIKWNGQSRSSHARTMWYSTGSSAAQSARTHELTAARDSPALAPPGPSPRGG